MSLELMPGVHCHRRFVIKTLMNGGSGRIYVAANAEAHNDTSVLKEIDVDAVAHSQMPRRLVLYEETVRALRSFEHPNLARVHDSFVMHGQRYVVMERVQGVTLASILNMSNNGLRSSQVMGWVEQICDALHYMQSRPRPFVFGALDAAHVMLTPEQQIKLVNYGLQRFFTAEEPPTAFVATASDNTSDYVDLGKLILQLLTGNDSGQSIEAHWRRVIDRCLGQATRPVYENFLEVKADLRSQSSHLQTATTAAAAPPSTSEEPALEGSWAYVVCDDNTLWMVNNGQTGLPGGVRQRCVIDGAAIVDLKHIAAGNRVFLSDKGKNRVLVLNGSSGAKIAEIPLPGEPRQLLLSPDQSLLLCVQFDGARLWKIRTDDYSQTTIGLPNPPGGLAVSPDNKRLYVSQKRQNVVLVIDLQDGTVVERMPIYGGPGPLLVSPDGTELWVACQDTHGVKVLSLVNNDAYAVALRARTPIGLRYTPDGQHVYALCQDSNQISVLSASDHNLITVIDTGSAHPIRWSFSQQWLWMVHHGNNRIGLIDPVTHQLKTTVEMETAPIALDVAL